MTDKEETTIIDFTSNDIDTSGDIVEQLKAVKCAGKGGVGKARLSFAIPQPEDEDTDEETFVTVEAVQQRSAQSSIHSQHHNTSASREESTSREESISIVEARHLRRSTAPLHKKKVFLYECGNTHVPAWKAASIDKGNSQKLEIAILRRQSPKTNYPTLLFLATVVAPSMFTALFWGVIPLGEPNTTDREKVVFLLLVSPTSAALFAGLLMMFFFASLGESQPIERNWIRDAYPALIVIFFIVSSILLFIYPFTGTFALMGIIPFLTSTIVTIMALKLLRNTVWTCTCSLYNRYLKVFVKATALLVVFVIILAGWVIGYRGVGSLTQSILVILLLVIVFVFKKIMLAFTDVFPYEIAMLMSGFWMENLDDTFQTLVFPSVANGFGFVILGLRKLLENVAYVGFLTDSWFVFRVWIKGFLKRFFTCHMDDAGPVPILDDIDKDDRGHSDIKPGYHRRQMQFIMMKIISQVAAGIFFLSVSPILRFGPNNRFYPLIEETDGLDDDSYRNACIFACVTFLIAFASVFIISRILHHRIDVYHEMKHIYQELFKVPIYLCLMGIILLSNQMLVLNVAQYHNRIWFYRETQPPAP